MQAAFIARELDYVSFDDRVQYETVKNVATDAKKITYVSSHNWGLQFNVTRKPFDDVRVRKAILLGMDRQRLLDAVTFGEGMISGPAPILPMLRKAGWGMPREEYMKLPGWRQPKMLTLPRPSACWRRRATPTASRRYCSTDEA